MRKVNDQEATLIAGRRLRNDLTLLRSDMLHEQAHEIFYAIDFTELFSFVFFDRHLENTGYWPRNKFIRSAAIDDACLRHILFSNEFQIFLLPPHQLELRRLVAELGRHGLSELGIALEDIENIERALRPKLRKIVDAFDKRLRFLKQDDRDRKKAKTDVEDLYRWFVEKVLDIAPSILVLSREDTFDPRDRLIELLERSQFIPFSEIVDVPLIADDLNQNILTELFHSLQRVRTKVPTASNRADAYAMATLLYIHQNYSNSYGIRFISRSEGLLEAIDQAKISPVEKGQLRGFFRHPRLFSMRKLICRLPEQLETYLQEKAMAFGWVDILDRRYVSDYNVSANREAIRDNLRVIRNEVKRLDNSTVLGSITESADETQLLFQEKISRFIDLDKFIELSKRPEKIVEALAEKAGSLLGSINESSYKLTGNLSVLEDEGKLSAHWASVIDQEPIEIVSNYGAILKTSWTIKSNRRLFPYRIELFNSDLRRFFLNEEEEEISISILMKAVREQKSISFEGPLAIAFCFAYRNRWDLAFGYSGLAVKYAETLANKPIGFEALYFRALSRRNLNLIRESMDAANLSALDIKEAVLRRQAYYSDGSTYDPRYLNELALLGRVSNADLNELWDDTKVELSSDPSRIWRLAYDLAKDDDTLRILILNNLAFDAWSQERFDEALELRNEMLELIDVAGSLKHNLPPNVIHTLYVISKKYGDTERDYLTSWARDLIQLYEEKETSPWEYEDILDFVKKLDDPIV